jgi:ribosome-binding ATPase YchF (GTP1/OBG family)
VRNFKKEDVPHPEGSIDPLRDIKIIDEEVRLADEQILKRAKKEKIQPEALLLNKDWFLLVNGEDVDYADYTHLPVGKAETDAENNLSPRRSVVFKNIYKLDLLWELEILEYADQLGSSTDNNSPGLKPNTSGSHPGSLSGKHPGNDYFRSSVLEFLNQFRKDLDLIQFFTFTKEITQGWFIKKDSSIIEAAGVIHSDFALKFKIAETISLENFVKIKDWEKAKKLGLIQHKGRETKIEENEIIFVKI